MRCTDHETNLAGWLVKGELIKHQWSKPRIVGSIENWRKLGISYDLAAMFPRGNGNMEQERELGVAFYNVGTSHINVPRIGNVHVPGNKEHGHVPRLHVSGC
jgi:hypothetical protein